MGNVNLEENNYRTYMSYEDLQSLVTSKVRGSILWMVLGLIITGVTGFFFLNAVSNGIISNEIFGPIMIGAIVLEFVTVIAFTALTYKSSAGALRVMFLIYSVLNGVTLSTLGLAYGLDSDCICKYSSFIHSISNLRLLHKRRLNKIHKFTNSRDNFINHNEHNKYIPKK